MHISSTIACGVLEDCTLYYRKILNQAFNCYGKADIQGLFIILRQKNVLSESQIIDKTKQFPASKHGCFFGVHHGVSGMGNKETGLEPIEQDAMLARKSRSYFLDPLLCYEVTKKKNIFICYRRNLLTRK